MFLFVRADYLPKLHDVTVSTTSEAGVIVSDKNGCRILDQDKDSVVSIDMVLVLVALKLKIIELYLRIRGGYENLEIRIQ
jgi:hypothetical protein